MGKTPREYPPRARRRARAPLRAAGLVLDWATLGLLGVATLALAVSTRLPSRGKQRRAPPVAEPPEI
jgi:hypothetical protein